MQIHRGLSSAVRLFAATQGCALTIGNFDGVHRGHQAMLALLRSEAQHRGLPSCVLTFEPHPRDAFAKWKQDPLLAPARIATLRDKLSELTRCEVDHCVILPFQPWLAQLSALSFLEKVLHQALHARYVLVGDDFRFGAQRQGDYGLLDQWCSAKGIDVGRMMSYEVHGLRVSSSEVRQALAKADFAQVTALLGRPYRISGHVIKGRQLGRTLGFRTLNLHFPHWKPAASGIFAVYVHGLTEKEPLQGVANLGVRPSLDARDVNRGRVLLETHCLEWPSSLSSSLKDGEAYGKIIQVDLLYKLHDEIQYSNLDALACGIAKDCADARHFFHHE